MSADDDGGARLVDVSGLPPAVADAITALVHQQTQTPVRPAGAGRAGTSTGGAGAADNDAARSEAFRAHLGDLIQAAETVKGFGEACLLDATAALVADVAADHGISRDDPRYAGKVAVHRKSACRAVVHELQLLTGSTLTAARDRVRFATALPERVQQAHGLLRSGGCTWDRARIACAETAHLDPVLAGQVIDRLLAPPGRTTSPNGGEPGIPVSHAGFRARIRRQLALVDGAKADRARRHAEALEARDACTFPGRDGTATLGVTGDATKVFTAQQRLADLARAAKAAGDPRTLAQLRADLAVDLLIHGVVPDHQHLGDAPAGRLQVIVPLAALLPEHLVQAVAPSVPGAGFGLAEVPDLGFLTPDQVRAVALQAGSTWARLVTDPISGQVIDAATTYRAPAAMARLIRARDHTCRAPRTRPDTPRLHRPGRPPPPARQRRRQRTRTRTPLPRPPLPPPHPTMQRTPRRIPRPQTAVLTDRRSFSDDRFSDNRSGDDRCHGYAAGMTPEPRKVVLTGAAGRIGTAIAPLLPTTWQIQRTDLIGDHDVDALDITDLAACRRTFAGADAIVHLAGVPNPTADWETLLPANLIGAHHVAQAAVDCGVRRLVLASSVQAVAALPDDRQSRVSDAPRPRNLYGATKAWAEALGSWVAATSAVSVVALRIGYFHETRPDPASSDHELSAWLSPRDAAELVRAAVEAESGFDFVVANGISANRFRAADLEDTVHTLGYRPVDDAWHRS